jgi:hypothetical protein
MTPQDVLDLKVRNNRGEMVPFGSFTTVELDGRAAPARSLQRLSCHDDLGHGRPGALHRRCDERDGAPGH